MTDKRENAEDPLTDKREGVEEPVFILYAKDVSAPGVIHHWVYQNPSLDAEVLTNALLLAESMEEWKTPEPAKRVTWRKFQLEVMRGETFDFISFEQGLGSCSFCGDRATWMTQTDAGTGSLRSYRMCVGHKDAASQCA